MVAVGGTGVAEAVGVPVETGTVAVAAGAKGVQAASNTDRVANTYSSLFIYGDLLTRDVYHTSFVPVRKGV
jgi:hypothetical protein